MKQSIALVLSGGAARGIAHIGIIEELEANGYEIKSIAGNSMGAFIGAIYATGKLSEFKEWALNLGKKDILKLTDITLSMNGFVKGERIFKRINTFLPNINIEELPIPYTAVAADLTNMQEFIFSSGNLVQAVRASISIPGVFKPVQIRDTTLVDGGVVNPIPLDRVKRTNGDILVASFVNANPLDAAINSKELLQNSTRQKKSYEYPSSRGLKTNSMFGILSKSTDLITYSLAMTNIKNYNPDILFNISRNSCGIFEFYKIEEMIEKGKKAALVGLAEYEASRNFCFASIVSKVKE